MTNNMKRGKSTCRILKEIRRQIAEANDISYITSECQYQGDCAGTCPHCEEEVRYLEQQLERRHRAGKAISLLGISAGVISSMTACGNTGKSTEGRELTEQVQVVDTNKTQPEAVLIGDIDTILKEEASNVAVKYDTILKPDTHSVAVYQEPISVIAGRIAPDPEDTLEIAPKMPEFPGGHEALMKYLDENLDKIPTYQGNGIQGRVIIGFVVGKDGSIINPRVLRSADSFLDKEALRVIKEMPKWTPGELEDGTKVYVKFTVPVMFRLR